MAGEAVLAVVLGHENISNNIVWFQVRRDQSRKESQRNERSRRCTFQRFQRFKKGFDTIFAPALVLYDSQCWIFIYLRHL